MNHKGEVTIEVTSRHGVVSDRMTEYARTKAAKLTRFNDQISRIQVVIDGPHESPTVDMVVHVDRHEHIVAREQGEHFNAAVDGLVAKMERQLVKLKERSKNHKGDLRA